MKFSRTFGVVRRLNNQDLNVSGILCTLNRAIDEIVSAEEYLTRKSRNPDIESRAVYSITDTNLDHGYYVLVSDDAFVVAMGISNDEDPKNYHMRKEINMCETRNTVVPKEQNSRSFEMFRISDSGELGQGIMKAFSLDPSHQTYRVVKNDDVPVTITLRNGQIIFSQ